jgi:SagB-type dehydrogenase family enzyme
MRRLLAPLCVCAAIGVAVPIGIHAAATPMEVALPAPVTKGTMSLEEALSHRRSVRSYETKPLTQQQLGQLLWATQGITDPATAHRTAPSAMARYPLTVYVFDSGGVFSYQPDGHKLIRLADQDRRSELAAVSQRPVQQAPVSVVITGDPARFGGRSAGMAERFTYLEVGHAAQNLALQATALGLATVTIGGFDPTAVAKLLDLPEGVLVVYVMPVGYPAAR